MLISEERKFVFIWVPKTGCTSVKDRILEIDPNVVRNEVPTPSGDRVPVMPHATAHEVRQLLGARASEFTFVAFLRNPYDVVASKYYYYQRGRPYQALKREGVALPLRLRIRLARSLPLWLWASLYPYRSSRYFITDEAGRVCVDRIGDFDRLQEDVRDIFSEFGYSREALTIEQRNVSGSKDEAAKYSRLYKLVVKIRSRLDLQIWNRLDRKRAA